MEMKKLLLAGAISLMATTGMATTLDIDEFTDVVGGDFANALTPDDAVMPYGIGTAGEGSNFIIGNLDGQCENFDCNGPLAGDTQDSFSFVIDAGFQATSLTVFSEGFPFELTYSVSLDTFPTLGSLSNLGFETFDVNTGGEILGGPLGAGTYHLSVFGQSSPFDGSYGLFYGVSIEVEAVTTPPAVPLPAGFPLMLAGLGAFALAKRRTKV